MRVLINALSARQGGIVTYTKNLMSSLEERGVDAIFALPEDTPLPNRAKDLHFPTQRLGPIRRAVWEQTMWRRTVHRTAPDILFSSANFGLINPPVPQVLLVREGGLFDPQYLGTIAPSLGAVASFHRVLRRRLILASARSSDLVMTPSGATRDLLSLWSKPVAERVEVNRYGVPVNVFRSNESPRRWREDGVLRLLMVSSYYPHKQPGLIAEATRILNEKGIKAHLTVTMSLEQVGKTPAGSKDKFLLQKGLERGDVSLIGHIDYTELSKLYHSSDLFVSPSLSETFGHPLVEAMSTGTIVVTADTPVSHEVCGDGAAYFDATIAGNLVDEVVGLDLSPERRKRIRVCGIERSKDYLNWDDHVDRLVASFEKLKNPGRR